MAESISKPCESPAQMPRGARFHEGLADGWSDGYVHGGFRRRLEFVEGLLRDAVTPGTHWLDAGCGSGILTRKLATLGATGDAIDGSPAMIRVASQTATDEAAPPAFAYRCVETVERLDSAANTYDGVLCSSVIEYLDAPATALQEIARVLKPGGRLLISVANRYSLVRNVQRVVRAAGAKSRFLYLDVSRATFSRGEISDALRACGMRVDCIRGFDPMLPAWMTSFCPPALIFVIGTKEGSTSRARPQVAV